MSNEEDREEDPTRPSAFPPLDEYEERDLLQKAAEGKAPTEDELSSLIEQLVYWRTKAKWLYWERDKALTCLGKHSLQISKLLDEVHRLHCLCLDAANLNEDQIRRKLYLKEE